MKIFEESNCYFLIFPLFFASLVTSNSLNRDAHEWSNRKCFKNEPPKTSKVNEGDSFELSCRPLDDCPHSSVYWIKQFYDGTIESINSDSRITVDREGTLRFRNVTKIDASDEYYYACAVNLSPFNQYKIGNRVILEVAASNEWAGQKCFMDQQPETIRINEGDPFKLSCQPLDDCPHSGVYWLIQDINGGIKSIDNPRMTLDPEGNLWFSSVTKRDASDDFYYACAVLSPSKNEYKIGSRVILDVNPRNVDGSPNRGEPVKQHVSKKNEIALRGKKIELFCIYGSTPLSFVVWSKDGKRIHLSDRVMERNYGKSLVIKNVNSDDKGVYTCDVINVVGSVKSNSVNLDVQ